MIDTQSDLNDMSIEALLDLNQKIQKTLKEKRKARHQQSFYFGDTVKIETEFNSDGKPVHFVLKLRQRYTPDSFITILTGTYADQFSAKIDLLCSYLESASELSIHIDSYKEG